MTTSTVELTTSWVAITDGIEDYALHVVDVAGDQSAKITLSDTTPVGTTPSFVLKEGEGFSSLTHPGKVWAKISNGTQVILVVNK